MSVDLSPEIEARLAALGFELADFRAGGTAQRPHYLVRIDRPGSRPGHGVTVEDCAAVSRALKRWLDDAGVSDTYRLEVSSPGVDRPLRRLADWERFLGHPVDVLVPALAGRFRVRPLAVHADPEPTVVCEFPRLGRRELKLSDIKEARLGFDW